MSVKKFLLKLLRYTLCLAAGLLAFAACGYTDYRLWPLDLPPSAHPRMPATAMKDKRLVVPFTIAVPAAEIATFNDQMEAFLRFEYLRGREAREGHDTSHMYLTATNTKKGPQYKIFLVTDNDLLVAEDAKKAKKALDAAQISYQETPAEQYELPNKAGALAQCLASLEKKGVNLGSIHATAAKGGKRAVVVYTVEAAGKAAIATA